MGKVRLKSHVVTGLELDFVAWLRARQRTHPCVIAGIGDDMATVQVGGERVLASSDMLLDGVHFDSTRDSLRLMGRKALACNLSDCAAMAVRPVVGLVSLAFPVGWSLVQAKELYEGILSLAAEYDLAIVGGDTTTWVHPLAIDISILAVPYDGITPVARGGAKPGDLLFVTGPLGGSLLGRHLTFTPRVREARALVQTLGTRAHAMMDLSDGLSLDLWRLTQASGVGAVLREQQLLAVISEDAKRMANVDGCSPLDHALTDGEDFELLLAVGIGDGPEALPDEIRGTGLFPVGTITECGFRLERCDGRTEELSPKGYVH